MVSSHVCNASIPELVKTVHVIDKLLSDECTVLTQGWVGACVGVVALCTRVGKYVRPKSK